MTREQWRILGGVASAIGLFAFFQSGRCPPAAALLPVPPDSRFDPRQLAEGTRVELEHTGSRATAKKIAKHHLLEDPAYYRKLATIHVD